MGFFINPKRILASPTEFPKGSANLGVKPPAYHVCVCVCVCVSIKPRPFLFAALGHSDTAACKCYLSYSGDYVRDYIGEYYRVPKADARSSDYGSHGRFLRVLLSGGFHEKDFRLCRASEVRILGKPQLLHSSGASAISGSELCTWHVCFSPVTPCV